MHESILLIQSAQYRYISEIYMYAYQRPKHHLGVNCFASALLGICVCVGISFFLRGVPGSFPTYAYVSSSDKVSG
jgi:hypothetical protein